MDKYVFVLFLFLMIGIPTNAQKKSFVSYNYELSLSKENVAATSGFKIFKVWSYCKKKELLTQEVCMRNAIHGVLFKGLAASDVGTQGDFPALCPDGYETHKEYFDEFFKSGDYKQFIQLTSKGAQQAGDVVKTANKEWKVGLLVQINVKALRKHLEKDGIIQGARDIFSR
jgi:hypothetical protein